MLIMTKSVLALMIGFLLSLLVGSILIPYLKEKAYQRLNEYLVIHIEIKNIHQQWED